MRKFRKNTQLRQANYRKNNESRRKRVKREGKKKKERERGGGSTKPKELMEQRDNVVFRALYRVMNVPLLL